jgi:putative endonuclease
MPRKRFFVYILTNSYNSIFYVGFTSNLEKRMYQHKNKVYKGFSEQYKLWKLVYFEETNDVYEAINREKQLKKWKRSWKAKLIREENNSFRDLSEGW